VRNIKVARIHGPKDVRLDEISEPVLQPGDVIVNVKACGICGSDLTYIASGGLGGDGPMPVGHEFAGIITDIGSEVTGFSVGDLVAGNPDHRGIGNGGPEGAMANYIHIPEVDGNRVLHKLPTNISFEEAALAEPLSVALHGIDLANITPNDKVVVLGAGPIGLCTVVMLIHRGVKDIVVVDRVPSRLARARKLGAAKTINSSEEVLVDALASVHGETMRYRQRTVGTDVFIDAAGAGALLNDVICMAKFGTRISIIALYKQDIPLNLFQVMSNEISIIGSIADNRGAEFQEVLDMMASNPIDLDALISHRYELHQLPDALVAATNAHESAKVMVFTDN
jgi:threonine dehydrogenase-like Zn-dependent dehydrogenase